MADKIPFGFRQDVEELPEPEPDAERKEINCTTLQQSMAWQPHNAAAANPNDTPHRYKRRDG